MGSIIGIGNMPHRRKTTNIRPNAVGLIASYAAFMGIGSLTIGILLPAWIFHPLDQGFRLDWGIAILGLPFIVFGLFVLILAGSFYAMKKWSYRWIEMLFWFGPGKDLIRMAFDFEGLIHQEDVRKAFGQTGSKHK